MNETTAGDRGGSSKDTSLPKPLCLADKIAIIYRGKILIQGSLDELKANVLGLPEYIVKFASGWDASRLELPKGMEMLEKTATSLKVRVEAPEQLNPELIQRLTSMSAPVVAFQEETRTLEQVYLKVMATAKGKEYVQ